MLTFAQLYNRHVALLRCRSKQRTPAAADAEPQPALTFEQLKAHLEQRSIGNKQQQQQPLEPGRGSSVGEPADNGELECGDVDIDDDLDDLVVEPPQQQQQHQATAAGAAGNMALPETQELLDELQPTVAAGGIVSGTEFVAGSAAPELDLQLDDAAEEEGSGAAEGGEAGSKNEAMAGAQPDGLGEEEAAGSGSDDGEELLDSSDEDLSGEGSGGAEEEEEEEEQQSSEPLAEPLHWEEEEEEIGVVSEPRQQEGADAAAVKREDPAAPAAAGVKKRAVMQRQRAAGGFIEAEADLSDDEGHAAGGDSDDDEDDEDDAELVSWQLYSSADLTPGNCCMVMSHGRQSSILVMGLGCSACNDNKPPFRHLADASARHCSSQFPGPVADAPVC